VEGAGQAEGARVTTEEVLQVFRDAGALLNGHFILSSGLRSPVFLQKARVFMQPDKAEKLCRALAEKIRASGFGDVSQVVSPAVGGIIPGYETARHLGVPAIYTERVNGVFELRRGFEIARGEKVIIVEDIVTTGLSIRECIEAIKGLGADVVAAACLIDRSGGEADVGVPLVALTEYKVPAYPADALPPELQAIPAVKPGSRGLA
jgi:orotate phosphoribosyltransferase